MGAEASKTDSTVTKDREDFNKRFNIIFGSHRPSDEKTSVDRLGEIWGSFMNAKMIALFSDFLKWQEKEIIAKGGTTKQKDKMPPVREAFYLLYSNLVNGDNSQAATTLTHILSAETRSSNSDVERSITLDQLNEFICEVFESYLTILSSKDCAAFSGWKKGGAAVSQNHLKLLAKSLTSDIECHSKKVSTSCFEAWLYRCPIFIAALRDVLKTCYQHKLSNENLLLPHPTFLKGSSTILTFPQIIYLGMNLPPQLKVKWRLLYSSTCSGESWILFVKSIRTQGPTVVLIREKDVVFGGFASSSWDVHPNFYGDDSCFLFTLFPNMIKFPATSYNKHYQYLNTGQSTLPNGLGMGGQFSYWGFYIDSSMTTGEVSASCTTFANYKPPVSPKFKIESIEVWALGDKPVSSAEEEGGRSALDTQLEAKAMLEMMGRSQASEGLRDEPKQ